MGPQLPFTVAIREEPVQGEASMHVRLYLATGYVDMEASRGTGQWFWIIVE